MLSATTQDKTNLSASLFHIRTLVTILRVGKTKLLREGYWKFQSHASAFTGICHSFLFFHAVELS